MPFIKRLFQRRLKSFNRLSVQREPGGGGGRILYLLDTGEHLDNVFKLIIAIVIEAHLFFIPVL